MVLTAAGNIKHEELVTMANKLFGKEKLPPQPVPTFIDLGKDTSLKPPFTGSQVIVLDDLAPYTHVAIAAEAPGWRHADYFTFSVLQTILGHWDRTLGGGKNLSSKICELLATEQRAVSYSTFYTCYARTGLFGSYIVGEPDKLEACVSETLNEWNRIGKLVSSAEVERAKNKLKASVLMQLDGTTAMVEEIGRQMLAYGRRLTPAEVFLRIDAVTVADIKRICSDWLEDISPAVALR